MSRKHTTWSVWLLTSCLAIGCEPPVKQGQAPPPKTTKKPGQTGSPAPAPAPTTAPANTPSSASTSGTTTAADADGGVANNGMPPALEVKESDFSENNRTRDPFHSFAAEFAPVVVPPPPIQTEIKLPDTALEDLRLVAVVVGVDSPYAMVVPPTGKSVVIRRGEFVGRPENVAGENGMLPRQVPWRVARIIGTRVTHTRDGVEELPGQVVFEREDRLAAGSASRRERILALGAPAANAAPTTPANGAGFPALPSAGLPPLPGTEAPLTSLLPPNAGRPGSGVSVQTFTTPPQTIELPPPRVTIQSGSGSSARPVAPGTIQIQTLPAPPSSTTNAPSTQPIPVQITSGPTVGSRSFPTSGLQP